MDGADYRILLHVTMFSGNDPTATQKVDSTFYRFNDVLKGNEQLPNIATICDYFSNLNSKVGAYIKNECLDMRKEDTIFIPSGKNDRSIVNTISGSERKNIRIILYPGKQEDIANLKLQESTHNMIVQFKALQTKFCAAEQHRNPPSFYQPCASEEIALRYLEALLVDACICHCLGISDVAYHHDDKQHISSEKVLFLKELVQAERFGSLSDGAKNLLKYVDSKIEESTPYISFLSIFTIAPFDILGEDEFNFYEDYCNLWGNFQIWYFKRHGRLFSNQKPIENPLETVFERNKYQGQISQVGLVDKIKELVENPTCPSSNLPFGKEYRFAIVIIKRVPSSSAVIGQFEVLFSGKIHQSKWDIVYWGDLEKYENIMPYLEIVPIMIM